MTAPATWLCVLGAVGYFVLMERHFLGALQLRTGPAKVGPRAILQPVADGLKLVLKYFNAPSLTNLYAFLAAPCFLSALALLLWCVYPTTPPHSFFVFGTLFVLCVSSVSVFGTIAAGWSSNSKFALIGAVRGVAQTISYEVSFATLLLFCIYLRGSFSLQSGAVCWFMFGVLCPPLFLCFLLATLAELNRAPFDLVEGESELVSGFNTEYGGAGFALIMIAEYANMMFMSVLAATMWLTPLTFSAASGVGSTLVLCTLIVLARGAFPRLRYDMLMSWSWKYILPLSLVGVGVVCLYICERGSLMHQI